MNATDLIQITADDISDNDLLGFDGRGLEFQLLNSEVKLKAVRREQLKLSAQIPFLETSDKIVEAQILRVLQVNFERRFELRGSVRVDPSQRMLLLERTILTSDCNPQTWKQILTNFLGSVNGYDRLINGQNQKDADNPPSAQTYTTKIL